MHSLICTWIFLFIRTELLSNFYSGSAHLTPKFGPQLKPLPKLGTAADDFDSWVLTAGILLSKVLFFSNKRNRLWLQIV